MDPTTRLPARGPVYAALDLGTNNCRLLVAVPARDGFRVVDAFSRIVRLGEGVDASGVLSAAARARAEGALGVCAAKLKEHGVTRARLIATEACRAAGNGADFLADIQERHGIELEIADRETEARLAAIGCAPLMDEAATGALLFDIGGGSTEIVWMERGAGADAEPGIVAWTSLPIGVVTLAERHGGHEVSGETFAAMVEEAARLIDAFPGRAAVARAIAAAGPRCHLLGTSGTVTTVAGVHLGLRRYDRRRVDGLWMGADDVTDVVERLLGWSYRERAENPCIGVERADLVLAGCAILEAIRDAFPAERLRVADRGLREGILIELMRADGTYRGSARLDGPRATRRARRGRDKGRP